MFAFSTAPLLNLGDLLRRNKLTEFLSYIMEFEDLRPILDSTTQKYTIFAPTNEAFANLKALSKKSIKNDRTYRKHIIKHHIIPQEVTTKNLRFNEFDTMGGDSVIVRSYEQVLSFVTTGGGGRALTALRQASMHGEPLHARWRNRVAWGP